MRTRIATSSLRLNILSRMFKRTSVINIMYDLKMKYGLRIPFSNVRKHHNEELFIALLDEGYVPNHTLQLYCKL